MDIDAPPMFPLPNSHQRSQAPAPQPTPSFSVAPPSPPRIPDEPASELNIAILPDATPLGDMAPPPSTTTKPNFGIQPGGDNTAPKKKKGKVALGQGYSALDWARLTSSGKDLKGTGMGFMRVTMAELAKVRCLQPLLTTYAQHKSKEDAWSAFNGKVYNITPYLPFHPGGEDELMRVAGRDGTKLFSESCDMYSSHVSS